MKAAVKFFSAFAAALIAFLVWYHIVRAEEGVEELQPIIKNLPLEGNFWLYFLLFAITTFVLWRMWQRLSRLFWQKSKQSEVAVDQKNEVDCLDICNELRDRLLRQKEEPLIVLDKLYHLIRFYLQGQPLQEQEKAVVSELRSLYGVEKVSFEAALQLFNKAQNIIERGS